MYNAKQKNGPRNYVEPVPGNPDMPRDERPRADNLRNGIYIVVIFSFRFAPVKFL